MGIGILCKKNKNCIIPIFIFLLLTFFRTINQVPTFDESHAWVVAKALNLSNWIYISKIEGHPLLWYLVLKPFTYFRILYPYSMMLINYFFCIASIFILWNNSPFSNLMKIGITFSAMYIFKLSVFSRGYALGVFLIFLICAYRREIIKKSYCYSLILMIALNVNIMCSIGVSWFVAEFFIKIIKSSFSTIKKLLLLLPPSLGGLLLVYPYLNGYGTEISSGISNIGPKFLVSFFTHPANFLLSAYSIVLLLLLFKIKGFWLKTFVLYTNIMMVTLFCFFYPGFYHHFMFFFIYLIVFIWITEGENYFKEYKGINILNILMIVMLVLPININLELEQVLHFKYVKNPKLIVKMLNNEPKFRNSTVYLEASLYHLIPYLKEDINLMNSCSLKPLTWNILTITDCVPEHEKHIKNDGHNTFLISTKNYDTIKGEKDFIFKELYVYKIEGKR